MLTNPNENNPFINKETPDVQQTPTDTETTSQNNKTTKLIDEHRTHRDS